MPIIRPAYSLPSRLLEQHNPSTHSWLQHLHRLMEFRHLLSDNNNCGSNSPGHSHWYRKLLLVFLPVFGHPGWQRNLSNPWLLYGGHTHGPTKERKSQTDNKLLSSQRLPVKSPGSSLFCTLIACPLWSGQGSMQYRIEFSAVRIKTHH